MSIVDVARALEAHRALVGALPSKPISVSVIRERKSVSDATAIYLIEGRYVLYLSPALFPEVAQDEANAIANARARLGRGLNSVLLEDVLQGEIDGRSFLMVPYATPFSSHRAVFAIQKRLMRRPALDWLRGLAQASAAPDSLARASFGENLAALDTVPEFSAPFRSAVGMARQDIDSGKIAARFTPMHGDLWSGNILRRAGQPLVVIDWRGSTMDGFAIYDLMRFAGSFRLSPQMLREELAAHAAALGVPVEQTGTYLMAGLGHYARNLGQFPLPRFRAMAETCFRDWSAALESDRSASEVIVGHPGRAAQFGPIVVRRHGPAAQ